MDWETTNTIKWLKFMDFRGILYSNHFIIFKTNFKFSKSQKGTKTFRKLRNVYFLFFVEHTGLFWQISFGNSNFGKTYFFNIFLLETLQDIWYFDILRKKEFFYISNYHIYWLELCHFYHFCNFLHFYLVTLVKDFDIYPL